MLDDFKKKKFLKERCMKKSKKMLLVVLIALVPVFAHPMGSGETTFDLGIYTGYSKSTENSANGSPMGIFGGISFGVSMIRAGVHVYSDSTMLDEFSRTSMGVTGRFQLDIPMVQPYFKMGLGIIDVFANPGDVKRSFFATYLVGGGLEMSFGIVKPFAEYTYWNSSFNGNKVKNSAFNLGVRIAM